MTSLVTPKPLIDVEIYFPETFWPAFFASSSVFFPRFFISSLAFFAASSVFFFVLSKIDTKSPPRRKSFVKNNDLIVKKGM